MLVLSMTQLEKRPKTSTTGRKKGCHAHESMGIICLHTVKAQYRKFETNISRKLRKGIASPQFPFHIHVSVRDSYIRNIPMIDLPIRCRKICRLILGRYNTLTDT
jgi:hypothetical protein